LTADADSAGFAILPMGAGKTVIAATAMLDLLATKALDYVWVVAPKRVANDVWGRELQDWAHLRHLRVSLVTGNQKQRLAALAKPADIYVTTFDLVVWLEEHLRAFSARAGVVIDETTRVKNPSAKSGKALRKLMAKSTWVWGLTGTPMSGGEADLFGQVLTVIGPGMWGKSFPQWQRQHFFPTDYQGYRWAIKADHRDRIRQEFADVCFTVPGKAHKAPVIVDHWLTLPPEVQRAHDTALRESVLRLGPQGLLQSLSGAAVATGKARQITGGTVFDVEGLLHGVDRTKLDAVREIAEDSGEPLLLLYQYRGELDLLREIWPRLPALGGGTSDRVASDAIRDWNAGRLDALAGHPASMAHGLNLQQGGRRMVFYSLPWSLDAYLQTIARLARQGQTQDVYVHRLLARNTIDEVVVARLAGNGAELDTLLNLIRKL
jgi:hypothetical protein